MNGINWGRVILGGLLAGLVLNIIDGTVYGFILADEMEAAMRELGREAVAGSAIAWFIVVDFLLGIFLVYLYAAIRPRFGPGAGTAVRAGILTWIPAGLLHTLFEWPIAIFPRNLMVTGLIVGLIGVVLAALVGGWAYREEPVARPGATER